MELSEIREGINRVDDQLLPLFLKRMELSAQVAAYKKETGKPVYDGERERKILAGVSERAGDMAEYARLLYSEIMQLSRSYQIQLLTEENAFPLPPVEESGFPHAARVACQGVEGAYSQTAAEKLFKYANIFFFNSEFHFCINRICLNICKYFEDCILQIYFAIFKILFSLCNETLIC